MFVMLCCNEFRTTKDTQMRLHICVKFSLPTIYNTVFLKLEKKTLFHVWLRPIILPLTEPFEVWNSSGHASVSARLQTRCQNINSSTSMRWLLKGMQGSQVSRIERDSHSFPSSVMPSHHTSYFSRWKKQSFKLSDLGCSGRRDDREFTDPPLPRLHGGRELSDRPSSTPPPPGFLRSSPPVFETWEPWGWETELS